jgi:hypothetical protein
MRCERDWRSKHLEMIKLISIQLGKPADIIEIYSGYKKNKFEDIAKAKLEIIDGYAYATESILRKSYPKVTLG